MKIGRRALPFTQVVRVVPSALVSASVSETYTLEVDGFEVSYTSDTTGTLAEVCTGLAAAINALANDDAILATGGASSGSLRPSRRRPSTGRAARARCRPRGRSP